MVEPWVPNGLFGKGKDVDRAEFKRETLCEIPKQSDDQRRADELWIEYYAVTEGFDRFVCSGGVTNGVAIPASDWEYKTISRHAKQVREELFSRPENTSIPSTVIRDSKRVISGHRQQLIDEMWKRLQLERDRDQADS